MVFRFVFSEGMICTPCCKTIGSGTKFDAQVAQFSMMFIKNKPRRSRLVQPGGFGSGWVSILGY
jgi:hypothetical protein